MEADGSFKRQGEGEYNSAQHRGQYLSDEEVVRGDSFAARVFRQTLLFALLSVGKRSEKRRYVRPSHADSTVLSPYLGVAEAVLHGAQLVRMAHQGGHRGPATPHLPVPLVVAALVLREEL